jgi:hypothetical protein
LGIPPTAASRAIYLQNNHCGKKTAAFGINPSVAIMMLDHGGRK